MDLRSPHKLIRLINTRLNYSFKQQIISDDGGGASWLPLGEPYDDQPVDVLFQAQLDQFEAELLFQEEFHQDDDEFQEFELFEFTFLF